MLPGERPRPSLVSRRHRSRKVGRLNRNHLVHSGAGPGESFGWHAVHGALVSSCAITYVVALGFARPLKCSDLMASGLLTYVAILHFLFKS
jgi:hypothetical protein